jgi:hypothetical protein
VPGSDFNFNNIAFNEYGNISIITNSYNSNYLLITSFLIDEFELVFMDKNIDS